MGAWWIWVVGGLALAVLEVVVPGYVFLGFAVGAAATGLLIGLGLLGGSLPFGLLAFAVLSFCAWAVLRRMLGQRAGQVNIWDRDVND